MTSRALCGGAKASRSTTNGFLSLGFGASPLTQRSVAAHPLHTQVVWRTLHSSAGLAPRQRHQQIVFDIGHGQNEPMSATGRVPKRVMLSHFQVGGFSGATMMSLRTRASDLVVGTAYTKDLSRSSSMGSDLLRRCFSFKTRCMNHGGKEPQDQSRTPSSPSASPPRGIRKVLPIASLTPHENIYTVPNLLTFSRLIAAPFIGYAILHDAHAWALGLFVYAGVSDLLDGWIARHWKLQTVVGSVVDPMADKILMTILTVCLAAKGALPVWVAAIILGRDVGLGIAAIYYRWISLPPPKTFTRYWDFSLPSAEVRPTTISKYNTFLQLALMGATTVAPLVTADVSMGLVGMQYLVATTTVWSGLSYVFSKDAVKILSQKKKQDESKDGSAKP